MDVLRFRWKRERGNDSDPCLDTRLAERREQSHFVNRIQSDSIGDVAQKSFSGLYHARAFEVATAGFAARLSVSSRSTYSLRMCMKSCAFVTTPNA